MTSDDVRGEADQPTQQHRGRDLRNRLLDAAPRVASTVAIVLGLLLIVGSLFPRLWTASALLDDVVSRPARATLHAVVLVSGWALLRVARGLRLHRRRDWLVAVVVCVAVVVADLLRAERRPVEGIITLVLLALLVAARSRFTTVADTTGHRYALRAVVQCLVAAYATGLTMLYLPGHVPAGTGLLNRLGEISASLVGLGGELALRSDRYADLFHAAMLLFGLVTLAAVVLIWLRPPEPLAHLDADDEQQLRTLLTKQGARDSLGYFALRRDKNVVWSPSGKAAITYRTVCGVALASADPIGDPEAWPGAMQAYAGLAKANGWTMAVMGCSEQGATVFRRELGLSAVELGDEAIVHTDEFSLEGRAMRGVRQACARVSRAGYQARVRHISELTASEIDELRAAGAAWRVDPVERGFSMALSRLGDPTDEGCVVVTAERNGELAGVLHFVPWSKDGLSLDLMRRDRNADNGLNEYMITELMAACPRLGIAHVSLNFAVFRDALARGERIGAGPVLRAWRRVLLIASKWYQIDSLYRFNDKFRPEWTPRFFSYSRVRDIPRISLAALEAEAFLTRPKLVTRMLGRG